MQGFILIATIVVEKHTLILDVNFDNAIGGQNVDQGHQVMVRA